MANANKQTGGRTHPELGETVNYFGDSEAKVRATFPAFVRSTFCGIESVSTVSWEKIKRDGGLRVGFEMAMRDGVHRKSVICDMMSHGLEDLIQGIRSPPSTYSNAKSTSPSGVSPACNKAQKRNSQKS